jgi:dipeptidyl aminopeptidase/acylaminoacyl peptidase
MPVLLLAASFFFSSQSGLTSAQAPARREDPVGMRDIKDLRLVYNVPGMARASVKKNITYKRASDRDLKMDAYLPPGLRPGSELPVVIFIHGGQVPSNLLTEPKVWGVFISYGQLMAASGLAAITFNHRYYSPTSLRDSESDVADLIKYVRDHAASLNIDSDRICLWAFSGGGPLLSFALRDAPSYVRCMVSYYGLLDLQKARKRFPDSVTDETLRDLSTLYHLKNISKPMAPMLIARAGQDIPEINESVASFVQEAFVKNAPVEVINHPAGRHGFDVLNNDERSREIIRATVEFVKTHLAEAGKR